MEISSGPCDSEPELEAFSDHASDLTGRVRRSLWLIESGGSKLYSRENDVNFNYRRLSAAIGYAITQMIP